MLRNLSILKSDKVELFRPYEKDFGVELLYGQRVKEPLTEVESFPIHYYEDGITGLEGCLTMREAIALQHWNGNKNYTFYDLMQQIIPKMPH